MSLSLLRYRYRSVLAVLLLPSLLLIGVFSYYPAVRSLIGGFFQWNGFSPPAYVGISQFRQYLQAPTFGTEVKNIAILTGGSILITLVAQFTAAEVVTHMPKRPGTIAKYVLVLPIVLPPLVLIEVWAYLLQPGSGLIDHILGAAGLPQPSWLSDPHLALVGILLIGFPWISNLGFLIFLGGLQNLPRDVLDAARLDGLGAIRRVFAIDIPLLLTSSLLANQVSEFDVNHAQVTNGLDIAVGIHKGIISMSNPQYAAAWKLLGQLTPYSAGGESTYDACSNPNTTTPPLSPQSLLVQGKVGILWGGSWWIPQLDSAGFTGKYGVFPEPPITTASTPVALGTSTVGVIGGPNGNGEWSITSQRADSTMTPAKTATVMNFMAWLFTPQHLGYWLKISGSGSYIPTEPAAPTVSLPGLPSLVPAGKVPTVVDVVLDDVLSTAATNSGMRLIQEYVNGSLSYSAFASQWQSLLTSSAQAWATQNHVDLSKY